MVLFCVLIRHSHLLFETKMSKYWYCRWNYLQFTFLMLNPKQHGVQPRRWISHSHTQTHSVYQAGYFIPSLFSVTHVSSHSLFSYFHFFFWCLSVCVCSSSPLRWWMVSWCSWWPAVRPDRCVCAWIRFRWQTDSGTTSSWSCETFAVAVRRVTSLQYDSTLDSIR